MPKWSMSSKRKQKACKCRRIQALSNISLRSLRARLIATRPLTSLAPPTAGSAPSARVTLPKSLIQPRHRSIPTEFPPSQVSALQALSLSCGAGEGVHIFLAASCIRGQGTAPGSAPAAARTGTGSLAQPQPRDRLPLASRCPAAWPSRMGRSGWCRPALAVNGGLPPPPGRWCPCRSGEFASEGASDGSDSSVRAWAA